MLDRPLWRTEPNGVLAAEADGFRPAVEAPPRVGGPASFMVLRRRYGGGGLLALVGSGTAGDVGEAVDAAERMAGRVMSHG